MAQCLALKWLVVSNSYIQVSLVNQECILSQSVVFYEVATTVEPL